MKIEPRNNKYNKDIINRKNKSYKQKKRALRSDSSVVIHNINDKKIKEFTYPLISSLTTADYFFDDVFYLIKHSDAWKYKEFLTRLLQQLKEELNLNADELTKQHVYSKLHQVSSKHFDVIQNINNSENVNIYNMTLSPYISSYILTILYPNIFENADNSHKNIFLSKYGAYIFVSFKLLEAALILDGFLMSIDNYCRQIIEAKNTKQFDNIIPYFTGIYDNLSSFKNNDTNNYCMKKFFAIYLYFIQYSRDVWYESTIDKKEKIQKHINVMSLRFFLNNKKV